MKKVIACLMCILLVVVSVSVGFRLGSNEKENEGTVVQASVVVAKKIINVPTISQFPDLPTGCEAVSATMVLQYYGVDITAEDFVLSWLECSDDFHRENGRLYGPDPNKVFAGNPFVVNSYGCFAEPIINAINHNSYDCKAQKISNGILSELCYEYIDNDKPLLIWATMNMEDSYEGNSWYLEDGTKFTWIAREHCLVLVGYNDAYYLLNDPMTGNVVAYRKDVVEKRFAELGGQAIYVSKNE